MVKKILKRWYIFPLAAYILYELFKAIILFYMNPIILGESSKNTWVLNSKSFSLEVACDYIGGNNKAYRYKVISIPEGLLKENWGSLTDLLYASPPGMIFGNCDFDQDKELLVLGCEVGVSSTIILNLAKNIDKYDYNDISYMGYYDFRDKGFQFNRIQDSPFFFIVKNEYIDGALALPEIWIFGFLVVFSSDYCSVDAV